MQKSVYSLVLSDEVVTALDRLAYRSGTSRSALAAIRMCSFSASAMALNTASMGCPRNRCAMLRERS